MRCFICDSSLSKPNFSSDHDCYDPCETCLAVVKDTLEGFLDKTFVAEDVWEEEPLIKQISIWSSTSFYTPMGGDEENT